MSHDMQGTHAPGIPDTAALRGKLTIRMWWTAVRNTAVYALMAFGVPPLGAAANRAGISWIFIIGGPMILIGIFGLLATLRTLAGAVLLTRTSRKTLTQYAFDTYCPRITKVDGAQATRGRPKVMTLELHSEDGREWPLMRINPLPRRGPWRNPWPVGIEEGVFVAGDELFGAVGYVPPSRTFFLMQPEDWETVEQARKVTDPDRVVRAQQAGLTRRIF
ncbi:hypothetical protein ACIRP3_34230 [Streptomyces sp. NPDC101209]|uniref:hypothetical protein n=1 Tax=Streptomyces sp. NPDC101209 TaxID=3366129 RepID=UPI00380B4609